MAGNQRIPKGFVNTRLKDMTYEAQPREHGQTTAVKVEAPAGLTVAAGEEDSKWMPIVSRAPPFPGIPIDQPYTGALSQRLAFPGLRGVETNMHGIREDLTGASFDADTFTSLYNSLLAELRQIDITSINDYMRYRECRDYFVDWKELIRIEFAFANDCARLLKDLGDHIDSSDGIVIVVDGIMPYLTSRQLKKLAVFSHFSALRTEGISFSEYDDTGNPRYPLDFWYGPDISAPLTLAYRHRNEVRQGIIVPVPTTVRLLDPDEFYFSFEDAYASCDTPEDDFDHIRPGSLDPIAAEVRHDLEEDRYFGAFHAAQDNATMQVGLPPNVLVLSPNGRSLGVDTKVAKIGFVLPSIEQLKPTAVRKLREDYGPDFVRFQRALARLAAGLAGQADEKRFRSLIQETENEVDLLHKTFESIRRTHRNLPIIVGMISMMFCIPLGNPGLEGRLEAIFSGVGTAFLIEYFRHVRETRAAVEASPFYFPLRLHAEATKDRSVTLV